MGWAYYTEPAATGVLPGTILFRQPDGTEESFLFYDRLEIGRYHPSRPKLPGLLLVDDPTVSRSHCFLTKSGDGRCWVRDCSTNGTRLDGRRLVPNLEFEIHSDQTLSVGNGNDFHVIRGASETAPGVDMDAGLTVGVSGHTVATVVVGDICDYTVMVRKAPPEQLQRSVSRVFEALAAEVVRLEGTVKEYQGDALFAFWEGTGDGQQAIAACRAVLKLDARARALAKDPAIWSVSGYSLEMDWGLSSGLVVLNTFGGTYGPSGLSMVGQPVVRAFRIEKFASRETGRIIACSTTRKIAKGLFAFSDLGERQAKGFDSPDHVFALQGPGPEM